MHRFRYASRQLNIHYECINECCKGSRQYVNGYKFKYDTGASEVDLLQNEEWKDVIIGPGIHEVKSMTSVKRSTGYTNPQISNVGRFRSMTGIIYTPEPRPNGYAYIMIMNSSYPVHGLVCRAFHGKAPSEVHTVDHIDKNPSNNHYMNLRWLSVAEQNRHSRDSNEHRRSSAKCQSNPIKGRKIGDSDWNLYASITQAARQLDLNSGHISRCCKGIIKHTSGFEFKYDIERSEPEMLPGEVWLKVIT